MAENNKDIDKLFREKLGEYSEMPTHKAWDRIQGRLDQKDKRGVVPWMNIAASALLLGIGLVFIYYSLNGPINNSGMIAQQNEVPDTKPGNISALEGIPDPVVQEEISPKSNSTIQPEPGTIKDPIQKADESPINLVIESVEEPELASKETIAQVEVESLDLPGLDTILPIEGGEIPVEKVKEVPYKITIISNGLSPRQNKDNLVNEIENKIDQLGGLLSKVDQEFAELQDSKNNLFASITSKKDNKN